MTEKLQTVEVYEEDLEALLNTLNTVYHFSLSYDLFNQYQKLSANVSPSPLTKQVRVMQNRFKGYLDDVIAAREEAEGTEDVS